MRMDAPVHTRRTAVSTSDALSISYSAGEKSGTLSNETIGALLARVIARQPDSPALVSRHQDIPLTYPELGHEAERVARSLLPLGIGKGARVGVLPPTFAAWPSIQFAPPP